MLYVYTLCWPYNCHMHPCRASCRASSLVILQPVPSVRPWNTRGDKRMHHLQIVGISVSVHFLVMMWIVLVCCVTVLVTRVRSSVGVRWRQCPNVALLAIESMISMSFLVCRYRVLLRLQGARMQQNTPGEGLNAWITRMPMTIGRIDGASRPLCLSLDLTRATSTLSSRML